MGVNIQDVTFAIKAQDGATAVLRQVRSAMGEVEKSYASLAAAAGVVATAVYLAIRSFGAIVTEAKEAEDQSKRLNAVLRATGHSRGPAPPSGRGPAPGRAAASSADPQGAPTTAAAKPSSRSRRRSGRDRLRSLGRRQSSRTHPSRRAPRWLHRSRGAKAATGKRAPSVLRCAWRCVARA